MRNPSRNMKPLTYFVSVKSSVVPNLHPPMMGAPQYIMGGTTMPFYQAPLYSFDEMPRIAHMPAAGYYDMGYTAPTSLSAGRDSMPNVAYTVADARFSGRGDNNASPVPSTLSQQASLKNIQGETRKVVRGSSVEC